MGWSDRTPSMYHYIYLCIRNSSSNSSALPFVKLLALQLPSEVLRDEFLEVAFILVITALRDLASLLLATHHSWWSGAIHKTYY